MNFTLKDVNPTQHKPILLKLIHTKTKQNKNPKEDHHITTTTTTTKSFKIMRVKANLINFKSKLSNHATDLSLSSAAQTKTMR